MRMNVTDIMVYKMQLCLSVEKRFGKTEGFPEYLINKIR